MADKTSIIQDTALDDPLRSLRQGGGAGDEVVWDPDVLSWNFFPLGSQTFTCNPCFHPTESTCVGTADHAHSRGGTEEGLSTLRFSPGQWLWENWENLTGDGTL
ncbi:hypothetical protein GOODEAATRI_016549 [Goodea atripinnis]|uniref:Uncharacterized protein n=1 Tax=Goodea atripinnis TaxID=208336 RepID=A0ABV0PEN0_9TELE